MLKEFYAVTMTSVYHVRAAGRWRASATKIALQGKSRLSVGNELVEEGMIAIRRNLQGYIPERTGDTRRAVPRFKREIENTNLKNWRRHSSPIVALFPDKKSALECFEHSGKEPCDRRWLENTKKTLAAIGDNHPSFYVSKDRRAALVPSDDPPIAA